MIFFLTHIPNTHIRTSRNYNISRVFGNILIVLFESEESKNSNFIPELHVCDPEKEDDTA
jgi:hypothetical protein